MKRIPLILFVLCAGLTLAAAPVLNAKPAAPEKGKPEKQRELVVVVVENLIHPGSGYDAYNRAAYVFGDVFDKRKWPVKVRFERFAANTKDHPLELQMFLKGIRHDFPDEFDFYAWVILKADGKKLDLGMVKGEYFAHPIEQGDDILDGAVRAGAVKVADKIQPYILGTKPMPGS